MGAYYSSERLQVVILYKDYDVSLDYGVYYGSMLFMEMT